MGTSRELLGRFPQRRFPAAVLVQIQLLVQARRLAMTLRTWILAGGACGLATGMVATAPSTPSAQSQGDPKTAGDDSYAKSRTLRERKNADDMPARARVDRNLCGIALVTTDGKLYMA